ncbi:ABC transporter substrate-binding protein [Cohnella sp. LGH]|uniref:nickel ABC transporter substrate-binding protein n=1 Tax=Cohnella sp. LGH TaxID=1619153 RepID=UPI001ADA94D0|nr:nickel ABC transporter substrate-binding protein [Cohnella sp. LGH]QTH45473.1 ABC transporter substrate-binding protein [Cohnella sp. LGH]
MVSSLRKKTATAWLLLILSLVAGIAGCSSNGEGKDSPASKSTSASEAAQVQESADISGEVKGVTIIHSLPVDTLDPHIGWTALRGGVTETLVRLDENMKIVPWLAEKWEAKDDLTWVFTLRKGIRFQDGTPLDAAAARASFERGVADSPALAASLKIASIAADGEQLTFVTSEPHPAFPTELVHPTASVVSIAAEQGMGKEAFNLAPVGTGPYKVARFVAGKELDLVRNEDYWDGKAKVATVKFQFNSDASVRTLAFQSKQADIVYHLSPETLDAIAGDPELSVQSVTSLRTHYFTYNPVSANVTDIRVRQALDKLIDRDAIVSDIMLGHALPASGPFSPKLLFGSVNEAQKLDPEGALALLESAGYTKGADGKLAKDGKSLTLKLIAFMGINPELPLIPLLVQSEAAKLGITVEIVSVEYPEEYIKSNAEWDLSTSSYLTAPRGDGGSFLNSTYVPGGAYNPTNIRIEGLEPILEELNRTGDTVKRNELSRMAVKTINEALPHSYIIHPNILVGLSQKVTGWNPGAEEFYIVTNKLDVR